MRLLRRYAGRPHGNDRRDRPRPADALDPLTLPYRKRTGRCPPQDGFEDLDQMEAMISATMSFVRDATQDGARTKLDLSSLVESLVDDMTNTGADVTLERADKVIIDGDPVGLKRLFSNLLENAVKYGKRARVRVGSPTSGMAIVEISTMTARACRPPRSSGCSSPSIAASPRATARRAASGWAWRWCGPSPAPTAATPNWKIAAAAA